MNKVLLLGIVLAVAGLGFTGENANAAKKNGVKLAAAKKAAPAPKVAKATEEVAEKTADSAVTAPGATATVPGTPAGQTTASAAPAVAAAQKKISGLAQSWNEVNVQSANTTKTPADVTELYLRLNYQLTDKWKVGIGEDLAHNLGNLSDNNSKTTFYDFMLTASASKLATLPGDVSFGTTAIYYVPTSLASYETRQLGVIRLYGVFSKDIGRLNLSFTTNPRFYLQRETAIYSPSTDKEVIPTELRLLNYLTATYKFSDKFSVYQIVGVDDKKATSDQANVNGKTWVPYLGDGRNPMYALAESGLSVDMTPNLNLTGGVTTYEREIRNKEWKLYDETARYFVSGTATF